MQNLLSQIMLKNNGGQMSQNEINKFYQDGANGIVPKYNQGLGVMDNFSLDEQSDGGIISQANNQGPVMNNEVDQNPLLAYEDSPSPMIQAGGQKRGFDIPTALSYAGAFARGSSQDGRMSKRILNGVAGMGEHQQNMNSYNAYKPYYNQMGINTDLLNPARGGGGFGPVSPNDIIRLQDTLETRRMNREYQQSRIQYLQNAEQNRNNASASKTIKVGDLMKISPAFKVNMAGQYDFTNGQNQELLDQQLPSSLVQTWMPAKNVNMNYTGGTYKNINKSGTTTSNINHHSDGGDGGGGSPYKEGQTATNPKTGEKMIFKGGKWQKQ